MSIASRLDLTSTAIADAAGVAHGRFEALPVGLEAIVRRISIVGGSSSGTARFYESAVTPGTLVATAPIADFNAAGLNQPVMLGPGIPLLWEADASVGAQVVASIYGEVRRD